MVQIVKRRGHKERFDPRKIYASCYAACLSSHLQVGYTEKVCEKVTREVKAKLKGKKEISSTKIFQLVEKALKKCDKDAAFMYRTHRDVS